MAFYGTWYQSTKFPLRVANLKWISSDPKISVPDMANQFFSLSSVQINYPNFPGVKKCMCLAKQVVYLESSWNPNKTNTYTSNSVLHTTYGLWQLSDVHDDVACWPTNCGLSTNALFNAEYNTRMAFTFMNSAVNLKKNPWLDWSVYSNAAKTCLV